MPQRVLFDVAVGDILAFEADAVGLKYAQGFHGADRAVAERLQRCGRSIESLALELRMSDHVLVSIAGCLSAPNVLFLQVPSLLQFRYAEIGRFATGVLESLSTLLPDATHVAMTMHGIGYGLDESAAIQAQYGGCVRAVEAGTVGPALERISIVEIHPARVRRLRRAIEPDARGSVLPFAWQGDDIRGPSPEQRRASVSSNIESAGRDSDAQRHIFVAMPFKKEMEDVYHYGIEAPVHEAGFLCERIDLTHFFGGIAETILNRIESAELVVADLSGANPNVYLEVGYAWGRGRQTILLVSSAADLKFDVAHMRCIIYDSIRDLEEKLRKELAMYRKQRAKATAGGP